MAKSSRDHLDRLRQALAQGDLDQARRILDRPGTRKATPRAPDRPAPRPAVTPAPAVELCRRVLPSPRGDREVQVADRTPNALGAWAAGVQREYLTVLRGARQRLDELEASPELCHAANAGPEDLVLVSALGRGDEEQRVFLQGVLWSDRQRVHLEQCLAEDPAAEPAVLQALADRLAAASVVVSFGQIGVTWEQLRQRAEACGVDLSAEAWDAPAGRVRAGGLVHLDLRKESRRRWSDRLRRPRLETVESRVLGFRRDGLISRADVPVACVEYLDDPSEPIRRELLHHNALDLVSMAQITCLLLTGCEGIH